MRRLRRGLKWWGLFALMPLLVALIVFDDIAPLSETWHMILLGVIAFVICALALRWVERHNALVEREGTDALITYRPLGGTLEAQPKCSAAGEPVVSPQERARPRLPVSSYDPLSDSPVLVSRSED